MIHMSEPKASAATSTVARVGTVMRAPKTAELIATHLRNRIVKGELKPGETLPAEAHLMEQFGVSRPTLREAFRILEAESLIGIRRGSRGGAQVLDPDPGIAARHVGLLLQLQGATIKDVYDARMTTEPTCARLLAKSRTKQDLADLQAAADDVKQLVEAGPEAFPDPSRWSGATYHFHELILQRCGNITLGIQGAVLADIVNTHFRINIAADLTNRSWEKARFQKTAKSYDKLVTLVEAKDADGAESHWRTHMEVAAKYLFMYDGHDKKVVELFD